MRSRGSRHAALLMFLCGTLFCPLSLYLANAQESQKTAQEFFEVRKNRFESTLEKAKSGDVKKQLEVSHLYRDGEGVEPDETEADYWLLTSAQKGNPEAQVELGSSLFYRHEYDKAFSWFLKAAEAGNVEGQDWVAQCLIQGQGTEANYDEAMQWLVKAAAQDSRNAIVNIGFMYEHGQGVAVDYGKALQWYKLAAEKGIGLGQVNLASFYVRGVGVPQDFKQAEHWYSLAAEQGFPEAQMGLAIVYLDGPPEMRNPDKAVPLLESAVERGVPNASTLLAQLYLMGTAPKLKKDPGRAMGLLKPAAEEGNVYAQVMLGAAEQDAKNFKAAESWYQKAAAQDDGRAMFGLAELYSRGEGVPRNFDEAAKLYVRANDREEVAVFANNAGWFFATCEDPKYRNPELAIKYGLKGVLLSESKNAGCLDTLAEAYFINAQYALAVSTELRALELEPENESFRKSLERFRAELNASKAKAQDSTSK